MTPSTLDSLKARGRGWVDQALVRIGERAGPDLPRILSGAASYIETGRLLREAGLALPAPARTRFEVLDAALDIASTAAQPLYLEFGVWQGESMRYVSGRLTAATARFVGFDSFEGLPDDWTASFGRGAFSTAGVAPDTSDPRVSYIKGWFDDTLPTFAIPPHDRLIVNVDSDIYSSAATVLGAVGSALAPGDLLYFDEFNAHAHEGRAFHEFRIASGQNYRVLAVTKGAEHILFQRTG
jgi:hypothetical protein